MRIRQHNWRGRKRLSGGGRVWKFWNTLFYPKPSRGVLSDIGTLCGDYQGDKETKKGEGDKYRRHGRKV